MFNPLRSLTALALGGALLAASGCTIEFETPSSAQSPRPSASAPRNSADGPKPGGTGGPGQGAPVNESELQQDIASARQVVDGYWRQHWSELFTGVYRSPRVHGAYDGNDLAGAPTCGGQPATKFNAYYCIPEDYIAWDINLMRAGYAEGDAWVYLIIAHEWGHAIQNRLKMDLVAQQKELQADCLAGATLYGAKADGTLLFEDGDVKELSNGLVAVGDDTEWTNPQDHGDPIERITAFGRGRDGGVRACLPETAGA
ncbi:neutral zinc metallopeptidase [Thermomonospora cellulosilytica]|uniref:Putative metalloprotease n=1 Tax=Thermomonospora cellulosilytica TaxID=1411118 RepID=A0A7W3N395_9ACTN|nr:neutral zinc metallopeptidase [Thermomonospora cellulosilytica]MBA9006776.1 putative metalloprotease [Thermomonospora cellulosilytica]